MAVAAGAGQRAPGSPRGLERQQTGLRTAGRGTRDSAPEHLRVAVGCRLSVVGCRSSRMYSACPCPTAAMRHAPSCAAAAQSHRRCALRTGERERERELRAANVDYGTVLRWITDHKKMRALLATADCGSSCCLLYSLPLGNWQWAVGPAAGCWLSWLALASELLLTRRSLRTYSC